MPDIFTKAKRSAVMAAIRGSGNKDTELRMMALLRAHGITGWRRQMQLRIAETGNRNRAERDSLPKAARRGAAAAASKGKTSRVSVDFTFRRERVALFVDGCFWHGCPRHGTMPAGNRAFWKATLARNTERDRTVTRALRQAGWTVLRIWEHDLAPSTGRAWQGGWHGPWRCSVGGGVLTAKQRRARRGMTRSDGCEPANDQLRPRFRQPARQASP
jgi:DNA mismatch endonuclease (patch repair protein)